MRIEASLLVARRVEEESRCSSRQDQPRTSWPISRPRSLAQFEGASGFQNLREDLNDRARVRGGEHVKELIIHGVVVE